MGGYHHFDTAQWPLAIVTLTGKPTDEQFAAYVRDLSALVKRPGPSAIVVDATQAPQLSPGQRESMGKAIKDHAEDLQLNVRGVAYVFSSALQRFVLSSIFLVGGFPTAHTVVSTREEALAWCRERIRG
ncbi:MAG: STAS/SEC14 domain-containing protein [Myxococcota bacterium]